MVMEHCPGWYCGKILLSQNNYSDYCTACPRGFRRDEKTFYCTPCLESPIFYDWLYLGFMIVLTLVLHWFFIDMVATRRSFSKDVLVLHISALIETAMACVFTLLTTNPLGSFVINSCGVHGLSDWYTLLHNPTPNYDKNVHCTQEAVYPLYTMVFVFYASNLFIMLLFRPWLCSRYLPRQGKMSIYAAMYFIPILAVIHALLAGLLYYSFPYLIVILSVISCAHHFSSKMDQTIKSLLLTTLLNPRNIIILLGHWSLHAYGIIAITQLTEPIIHSLLILLVPLPTMFYVFTAKFTDPSKFQLIV